MAETSVSTFPIRTNDHKGRATARNRMSFKSTQSATKPKKPNYTAASTGSRATQAAMTSKQSSPECNENFAGPSIHDLAREHRLVGVR